MRAPVVVVVGASAGGVEALRSLAAGLPADLPAAVLIVLHIPRNSASALPLIISRAGPLTAHTAVDGELLRAGEISIAPADRHLLILDGRIRLSNGPTENGHRPAVDPLFRSAARAFGSRTIGVVLSGNRDDGTSGMAAVIDHGGAGLVQDPADALYPSMPQHAMAYSSIVSACPAADLGSMIGKLARARAAEPVPVPAGDPLLDEETAMARLEDLTTEQMGAPPAGFGCPSCHGALFELPGQPAPRFRCRVGHAWSAASLLDEQSAALEGALWMALRSLEEKAALSRRMADTASRRGRSEDVTSRLRASGEEAHRASGMIRELIDRLAASGTTDQSLDETPVRT